MNDIKAISLPKPFEIPNYDFRAVRQIAKSTNLERFYSNILVETDQISVNDYTYGLLPQRVKQLHDRLEDGYDWNESVKKMKAMGSHFTIDFQHADGPGETSTIHFVHSPSDNEDAIPLVLVHGWPGSFFESNELLPLLKKEYHVEGQGPSNIPRWTLSAASKRVNGIMLSLGYDRYVAQGGDLGNAVVRRVAQFFPNNCVAIHLNNAVVTSGGFNDSAEQTKNDDLTEMERRGASLRGQFVAKGSTYFQAQGTVRYTLGATLYTSPLATILWISEKLYRWSSPDTPPSLDFALTTCLLYWLIGSVLSSMWSYFIVMNHDKDSNANLSDQVLQPAAIGMVPSDLGWQCRKEFETVFRNLKSWHLLDGGGHFAAQEVPALPKKDFDILFKSEEVLSLLGKKD